MSITNNNTIAKIAATVAGIGLVALAFAPFAQADTTTDLQSQINALLAQIASLQSQLGQSGASATGGYTFNTDLTIGSTGADVTTLQTWLISKGYSIPAGATGYFGSQTQAAVAAFQAANGIMPAAGYFGPITRAKVNAMEAVSTPSTTGTGTGTTTTTTLSGGEATLSNYQLLTGNTVSEGQTGATIATAKFNVQGGDINVGRVRVELQGTNATYSNDPWLFLSKLYVYDGNSKVGSVDVSSRGAWNVNAGDATHSGEGDVFSVDIPTNDIIKEGDTANLTIEADAQSTIDSTGVNQTFHLDIPDNGLRALDAAGIQEYTGSTADYVNLSFNGNNAGKLTVSEDSADPQAGILVADANQSTNNLTIFKFDLTNTEDSDSLIDSITVPIATTTATGGAKDITSIISRATLQSSSGQNYDGTIVGSTTSSGNHLAFTLTNDNETVKANSTNTYTLVVNLASQLGHYASSSESLTASVPSGDVTAEGVQNGQATPVTGTAQGNTQTIALNAGIAVSGSHANNTAQVQNSSGNNPDNYGSFSIALQVTADGNTVYIPKFIASTTAASTTSGIDVNMNYSGTNAIGTTSVSLSSTANTDTNNSQFYIVQAGATQTFTASVIINPSTAGYYAVAAADIRYATSDSALSASTLTTLTLNQNNSQFNTDQLYIPSP